MKKTLTFFLFFTLVLSIFFVFLPHDTVKAITYYTTTIENFDSYAEGVHSGSNSYLSWSSTNYGATTTLLKVSSPMSLALSPHPVTNTDYTYLNLTSPMNTNSFSFAYYNTYTCFDYNIENIDFINSTGSAFIRFKIVTIMGSVKLYIWDYNTWYDLGSFTFELTGKWNTISFQGNHTSINPLNYVYYKVYNGSGLVEQVEKRWNSTNAFVNQSVSKIKITFANLGTVCTGILSAYDDFKLGYEDLSNPSGNGFIYDEGYIIRCMNSGSTSCTSTHELLSDCNIDWGCGIASFFYLADAQDCSDCTVTFNPTRYVEYLTQYQYNEIIHDVFLPIGLSQYNYVSSNPSDYSMTINGVSCGTADYLIKYGYDYALVWKDVDRQISNEYILFSFKCDKTTSGYVYDYYWLELFCTYGGSGTTKTHNVLSSYLNNQLDGQDWGNVELNLCWSFNESTIVDPYTPNVAEIIVLDYYDDYFGTGDNDTGYMEFYNFEQLCSYTVGQSPIILFNLTGYNTSKIKYYAYQIYQQQGTTNLFVDNGIIEVTGKYRKGIIHSTFKFPNSGKYYIMVYNATSDGMTLNNFIHRSESVGVCDTVTQPVTKTTEIEYNWIFALCIIMGFIIAPVILFRNNQFFIHNGSIVVALFGIIGLGICINFRLVELWFAFLIALICVGIMALKIYQLMNEREG